MAGGAPCRCEEKKKPVEERDWTVLQYRYQRSAFNGYKTQTTDRSTVTCNVCGGVWRTAARYVESLKRR